MRLGALLLLVFLPLRAPDTLPPCIDARAAAVERLVAAIATIEGWWAPGAPCRVLNNPGCLRTGVVYYAYATPEEGFAALRRRVQLFGTSTLREALRVYNSEVPEYGAVVLSIARLDADLRLISLSTCR